MGIINGIELTSGSRFQVQINDDWINIIIEHSSEGYYAIPNAVRLLPGLSARFIPEQV